MDRSDAAQSWRILVIEDGDEAWSGLERSAPSSLWIDRGAPGADLMGAIEREMVHALVVDLDAADTSLEALGAAQARWPSLLIVGLTRRDPAQLPGLPDVVDYSVPKPVDGVQLGRLLLDDLSAGLPQRRAQRRAVQGVRA